MSLYVDLPCITDGREFPGRSLLLARNEHHLGRRPPERSLSKPIKCLLNDKPGIGATRRDPVQIRERFMLGLGVREAL